MKTVKYSEIKDVWPKDGRHILARYDDNSIVVYQAFCPEIAKYAVENDRFGGPKYSFDRMTWVKTNFLWMMYRAGWATKKNQEHILAITLKRDGFDEILRSASEGKGDGNNQASDRDDVRLQWDPDHHPTGAKLTRRAIQLGLRRDILKRFHKEWIIKIEDITDFVQEQYEHVKTEAWEKLLVPEEDIYTPEDEVIRQHIRLDSIDVKTDEILEGATGGMDVITTRSIESDCERRLDAVLCLGGAFNPVHSRHIQLMTEVKSWLETNTTYRVIAGILAVAPDGYVKKKSKSEKYIKSGHRIELCRLACEDIDWLNPSDKPTGSAKESGVNFRRKDPSKPNIQVIVIVGADRAVNKSGNAKWHKPSKGIVTACMGRNGQTDSVRCKYEQDLSEGKVENDSFYFILKELENVSSTDVRNHLSEVKPDGDIGSRAHIVMETVRRGWLNEKVAQYIIQNFDDLYL